MSEVLDVKGLNCPLPVLRTKKKMKSVPKGEVLTVEATDPNAARDIPALCEASGFALLSLEERDGVFVFQIRQAA
jgi:tRNA 2-thiouridine synthesizing protein A